MICFNNGGRLIDDVYELPCLPDRVSRLYVDFETASNDPSIPSFNVWDRDHCTVLGLCVTWDDFPGSFYVPRRVLDAGGTRWFVNLLDRTDKIVNHNVKYDVHVAKNDLGVEMNEHKLSCTLARSRVYDADRTFKGGYALDTLADQLLGRDIYGYGDRLQPYLGKKNKDYGRIPVDILAEYGCEDVITNRLLDKFLLANTSDVCDWVVGNEERLTNVLVRMEREGLRIDRTSVKMCLLQDMYRMQQIEDQLQSELGYHVMPSSPTDVHDLLITRFCFPPIADEKSETGNPSFNKKILRKYAKLPGYEKRWYIVELIEEYRSLNTHKGLYWESWLSLADEDDILHSSYTQNVRSSRTACKQPNSQQLDKRAKAQIIAKKGRKLLCYDYQQQEYRWMVHYLENEKAIHAYNTDPSTDYHKWVAELCGIERRPAKTMNFTIAFGGGKKRVIDMLSIEPDVVKATGGDQFETRRLGLKIYEEYHKNLPELKHHQRLAENAAKKLGYVRTLYGRLLHLPYDKAYKGFNRVVQGTAADNTKESAVEVSEHYNTRLRELDCKMLAIVHDEFVFDVPDDENTIRQCDEEITRCLQLPSKRCRVPITVERGEPSDTWAKAKP